MTPIPSRSPEFYISQIPVYGDLALAPMDGYSDQPFRSLCRDLGSAMSYTEFINALDILQGHPYVWQKYQFLPEERPVVFQIFDNDPKRLLEAALRLQEHQPDIIDINLGCSVNTVSGRGAGAGLLRTPQIIGQIFELLSHHLEIPVSAKIRLGWDDSSLNYSEVAHIIEDNGGSLIAVHARTRMQHYGGQANWDAIAEVKQSVNIPVLGNGDVCSVADIKRLKEHTKCDGVLIGRAAIGNPWIFSRLDRQQVSSQQVREMMTRHLERMLAFYSAERGLILFRKHACRYISLYPLPKDLRHRLLTARRPEEFLSILDLVVVDEYLLPADSAYVVP